MSLRGLRQGRINEPPNLREYPKAMNPNIVQMVQVPINGRMELMTESQAEGLRVDLCRLLGVEASSSRSIKAAVCAEFGVRQEEMNSAIRTEHVAFARQVAMMLHRKLTGLSLAQIGELFPRSGKPRDHGTVLHACRAVGERMATDKKTCNRILKLEKQLTDLPV